MPLVIGLQFGAQPFMKRATDKEVHIQHTCSEFFTSQSSSGSFEWCFRYEVRDLNLGGLPGGMNLDLKLTVPRVADTEADLEVRPPAQL